MIRNALAVFALGSVALVALAQSTSQPALYVTATTIAEALAKSATERPGMAVGTVTTTDDYRINLIRRTEAAGAIVHEVGTELHYITEGAGTLVTGGTLVPATAGGRETIADGVSQRVTVGDAILIPEGTPHMYSAVEGAVTYLEVRF